MKFCVVTLGTYKKKKKYNCSVTQICNIPPVNGKTWMASMCGGTKQIEKIVGGNCHRRAWRSCVA